MVFQESEGVIPRRHGGNVGVTATERASGGMDRARLSFARCRYPSQPAGSVAHRSRIRHRSIHAAQRVETQPCGVVTLSARPGSVNKKPFKTIGCVCHQLFVTQLSPFFGAREFARGDRSFRTSRTGANTHTIRTLHAFALQEAACGQPDAEAELCGCRAQSECRPTQKNPGARPGFELPHFESGYAPIRT